MSNVTRVITSLAPADDAGVHKIVTSLARELDGAEPSVIVGFASPAIALDAVRDALRDAFPGVPLLASSSAGEFTEQGDAKQSISVAAVVGNFRVHVGFGGGLGSDVEAAVKQASSGLPTAVEGYPHCTAVLLLDPLAGNGEEAALLLTTVLGPDVRLAGGAAGDDLAMKETTVATTDKLGSNALAVGLIFSKTPLGLGVCHGHQPLSEPLRVTKAAGSVVSSIEGRPAWDVWKDETRAAAADAGIDVDNLTPDQVGAFLLRYEAGLRIEGGHKIRAPLSLGDDGSLSFACGIPEGAVIRIMESEATHQVSSARGAAKLAKEDLDGRSVAGAIVFDCICRNLILGERFADAVSVVSDELGGARLAGFETYGEIALNAGDMSAFHNTTTVVLAFPADGTA